MSLCKRVFILHHQHRRPNFSFTRKVLSLQSLDDHIVSCLHEVIAKELKASNNFQDWDSGKLGPADCHFDTFTNVGQVLLEPDKLGVSCGIRSLRK